MPTKIIKYACDICGEKFDEDIDALICEQLPIMGIHPDKDYNIGDTIKYEAQLFGNTIEDEGVVVRFIHDRLESDSGIVHMRSFYLAVKERDHVHLHEVALHSKSGTYLLMGCITKVDKEEFEETILDSRDELYEDLDYEEFDHFLTTIKNFLNS